MSAYYKCYKCKKMNVEFAFDMYCDDCYAKMEPEPDRDIEAEREQYDQAENTRQAEADYRAERGDR